jgi:hypothetical protein
VYVLCQDLRERKLLERKGVRLVNVGDVQLRMSLLGISRKEKEKGKKERMIIIIGEDTIRGDQDRGKKIEIVLIRKMDAVKSVLGHCQRIEKRAYVKFQKMFVKLNFDLKVVNYVAATVVIRETLMKITNTHLNSILSMEPVTIMTIVR